MLLCQLLFRRVREALWCVALSILAGGLPLAQADEMELVTHESAARSLRKAAEFFRSKVSVHGGYVWRYSHDLKLREGEGITNEHEAWIQPPGTPTVGEAFLLAYKATGEQYYLDAAKEAAYSLWKGQFQSGGWYHRMTFDPQARGKFAYRVEPNSPKGQNDSTLDDNKTQSCLRFLMHMDETLEFKDEKIHEAIEYAFDRLLAIQYPSGGWPQQFNRPVNPDEYPVKRANYPETWSRTHPKVSYKEYYTFNDNTMIDMLSVLLEAAEIYSDDRYLKAAEKTGDFILLAQMPEPQPAWAQQYDAQMQPAWARKFEPPAISGGESQGILRGLILLYRHTGKKKYLEPIPRALAYLQNSLLPEKDDLGESEVPPPRELARFYELKTNRPLYFTKDYKLTYEPDDVPTHYGFILNSSLDQIEMEYKYVAGLDPAELKPSRGPQAYLMTPLLSVKAQLVVDGLDEQGAWIEHGKLQAHEKGDEMANVINSRTFSENVKILCEFLMASQ